MPEYEDYEPCFICECCECVNHPWVNDLHGMTFKIVQKVNYDVMNAVWS